MPHPPRGNPQPRKFNPTFSVSGACSLMPTKPAMASGPRRPALQQMVLLLVDLFCLKKKERFLTNERHLRIRKIHTKYNLFQAHHFQGGGTGLGLLFRPWYPNRPTHLSPCQGSSPRWLHVAFRLCCYFCGFFRQVNYLYVVSNVFDQQVPIKKGVLQGKLRAHYPFPTIPQGTVIGPS